MAKKKRSAKAKRAAKPQEPQVKRPRGRPKGSLNKKTVEIAERAAEKGITPLEVMLETMNYHRDQALAEIAKGILANADLVVTSMAVAHNSAKDAAPFMHPKLANIDAKIEGVLTHEVALKELMADDTEETP